MSVGQILFDVLDFHQELYYEGAKRRARLVVWATAVLAVQVVLTIIFLPFSSPEPFAFFFLGTVSGMWIYSLCDAICARKLYKEYLRYRLEVECEAYSEEAKR